MDTGVDAKLLKSTKFPPQFNQKVDMNKVNNQVMKSSVIFDVEQLPQTMNFSNNIL
jgi:serine/arginine repetitive matrix protein 1